VQANEQVPLFMRAADMQALPSYSEGMPTVLVEAGAAGLPVISTGVGGIPELLAGGRGYLIPAKSVEALRGAIKRVLTSPGEAAGYAERLGAIVRTRYDAWKNAQDLLELFQRLRAKTGTQAPRSAGRNY
jgi:teichuronic acid biosynthesis glycosyltransferase TuaC